MDIGDMRRDFESEGLERDHLDDSPFRRVHEPGHPDADAEGYLHYPNIDPAMEMVNAMEANRAYEANITAVEATKTMMNSALRLLA